MKTNDELIVIWNELPSQEKMAMGDHYIYPRNLNLKAMGQTICHSKPIEAKKYFKALKTFQS